MPYDKNADLPEAVRNALPSEAQDVFRGAFNAAYDQYEGDEEKANATAWAAVKKAGFDKNEAGEWIKMAQSFDLTDKEIMSVGKWNGIDITDEMLDAAVKSFQELKDAVQPMIKLGHDESKWKDGLPALGWVDSLKKVGNKLIASFKDVPEIMKNAVDKKMYKRVSAEFYKNFVHNGKRYPWVLANVAFLGSDLPAVRDLADLSAYFHQKPDEGSFDEIRIFECDYNNLEEEEDKMSDQEVKEFTDKISQLEAENAAKEAEIAKFKADLEALQMKNLEVVKTAKAEEVKSFCDRMVSEMKMTPAARDILANGTETYSFTEAAGFSLSWQTVVEFMDAQSVLLDAQEKAQAKKITKVFSDVTEEVNAAVMEFIEAHPDTKYRDALVMVLENDEDLANRYKKGGN